LWPPRDITRAVKANFTVPVAAISRDLPAPVKEAAICYDARTFLGVAMARWVDRLDRTLGRLFFRAVGMVCAIVAMICGYAVWWHFTHWNPAYSLWPVIMFSVAALAAVSVLPHCFSCKRTFGEALDAMEGGAGDQHRPRRP